MWYLPGTSANVILMWDIIHLMSRNVTLPLHLGVRRSQRYYVRCRPMNGKIFWLKTPSFPFRKTCLYSSSTCFWVKASAGRKSSTCSQRAKNLNSATLRVINDHIFSLQQHCSFLGKRVETSDPCCEEKFANVIYTIRLWRYWNQTKLVVSKPYQTVFT